MMDFVFNGVAASQMGLRVIDIKRAILPALRDIYDSVPGRIGSYLYVQPYGDRKIEVSCALISQTSNNLWYDIRNIASWLNTTGRAPLMLDKEPGKYYMAKVANMAEIDQFLHIGKITLEFNCEPYAYSVDEIVQQYTAEPEVTQGLYNNGTAETYPIITVMATNGEIKNPKLQVNDVVLLYNGTITNGNQVDFNAENFTAYKGMDRDILTTGGYDPVEDSVLALLDGDFPALRPGPNSMVFSCDNNVNADIKIKFRERWI